MSEEKTIKKEVSKTRGRKKVSKDVSSTESTGGVAVQAESVKKNAQNKTAGKKTAVKKAGQATVKTAAKKKDPKTTIVIEYEGKPILVKDVIARAVKAYKKSNKGVTVKKIDIYIKPEENAAYYVVNGDASPSYKVTL